MYHGFFGHEHIEAMLHVLHAAELPLIVNELSSEIENKILYDFHPYFQALIEALPPMKLPKLAYGVVGGHGFFEVKLKNSIGSYEPLRPAVFQMLREIGNAILFVRSLELVQKSEHNWSFQQHAHFAGIKTHPQRQANAAAPSQPPATTFNMPSSGAVPPLLQALRDAQQNYPSNASKPLNQNLMNDSIRIAEDSLSQLYQYEQDQNGSLVTGMLTRLRHQILNSIGQAWNGQTTCTHDTTRHDTIPSFLLSFCSSRVCFYDEPIIFHFDLMLCALKSTHIHLTFFTDDTHNTRPDQPIITHSLR
jgi:hypothetical protein